MYKTLCKKIAIKSEDCVPESANQQFTSDNICAECPLCHISVFYPLVCFDDGKRHVHQLCWDRLKQQEALSITPEVLAGLSVLFDHWDIDDNKCYADDETHKCIKAAGEWFSMQGFPRVRRN